MVHYQRLDLLQPRALCTDFTCTNTASHARYPSRLAETEDNVNSEDIWEAYQAGWWLVISVAPCMHACTQAQSWSQASPRAYLSTEHTDAASEKQIQIQSAPPRSGPGCVPKRIERMRAELQIAFIIIIIIKRRSGINPIPPTVIDWD